MTTRQMAAWIIHIRNTECAPGTCEQCDRADQTIKARDVEHEAEKDMLRQDVRRAIDDTVVADARARAMMSDRDAYKVRLEAQIEKTGQTEAMLARETERLRLANATIARMTLDLQALQDAKAADIAAAVKKARQEFSVTASKLIGQGLERAKAELVTEAARMGASG